MAKRPWFKLFVADWVLATSSMTLEEQGAYMRLLMFQWSEGSISTDPRRIALKLGVSRDHYDRHLQWMVELHFPGGKNPRMEKERQEIDGVSLTNSINGKKRAEGVRDSNGRYIESSDRTTDASTEKPAYQSQKSESDPERDQKKTSPVSPGDVFDFAQVYEMYPRKIGRKKGLQRCRSQIKTREKYDALLMAVKNYAVLTEGSEYVKHFDTFMGCWEDYVDAGLLTPRVKPTNPNGPLPPMEAVTESKTECL